MTEIEQAFEDVKAAKLRIDELLKQEWGISTELAVKRQELAEIEERSAVKIEDIQNGLRNEREKLQRGLQRINDAPLTAAPEHVAAAVERVIEGNPEVFGETPIAAAEEVTADRFTGWAPGQGSVQKVGDDGSKVPALSVYDEACDG